MPLGKPAIFREETFSPVGWKIVNTPVTLSDLVNRNTPHRPKPWKVTFYRDKNAPGAPDPGPKAAGVPVAP